MKKLICLLLVLTMVLTLVACGQSTKNEGNISAGEAASTWPQNTVNVYCNQSAGGGTDMMTRLVATAMSKATGKNFVVINDNSGGTTVACETVRTSDPKAENVLVCNTGTLTRMISGQYNQSLDDFSVLGVISSPTAEGYGIFVKSDAPFADFEEFLTYAKDHPGELLTNGQAGGFVMFMEAALEKQLEYRGTFVDGGSDADRILDLLGESTDYALLSTTSAAQYVEAGDLRCLVMVGSENSELIPDVQTLDQLGYNSLTMFNCLMLLGPAGMSQTDIDKVGEYLKIACADTEVIEGYKKMNSVWTYKTPAESKEYLNQIMAELSGAYPVVQEMGLG